MVARAVVPQVCAAVTASQARKTLFSLVDDVAASHGPVLIAGKRNAAVLLSQQDWWSIQETLHLASIPGMAESIKEGMATPASRMRKRLPW